MAGRKIAYKVIWNDDIGLTCRIKEGSPYLGADAQNNSNPYKVGLDPRLLAKKDIISLGHPASPIRAIRAKCLDCCYGSEGEVRKCSAIGCPLWPLRMGKNVYHANARSHGKI